MIIMAWNMAHWQYKSRSPEAWDFLTNIIAPDIALVQEDVPPTNLDENYVLWKEIGGRRDWGSGIITKGLPIVEVEFENSYSGSLVIGDVSLPDGTSLTIISIYGLIDKWGYAITTLHRMLSDLTPLLVGKLGKRKQIVIGGDLNASIQCDEQYGGQSHRIFFDRLKDFGLIDCLGKFYSGNVQTQRHRMSNIPWQNDYIFASKKLAKQLESCEVINDQVVWEFSDHNPVVAGFYVN